jgi:hypothetical protein
VKNIVTHNVPGLQEVGSTAVLFQMPRHTPPQHSDWAGHSEGSPLHPYWIIYFLRFDGEMPLFYIYFLSYITLQNKVDNITHNFLFDEARAGGRYELNQWLSRVYITKLWAGWCF